MAAAFLSGRAHIGEATLDHATYPAAGRVAVSFYDTHAGGVELAGSDNSLPVVEGEVLALQQLRQGRTVPYTSERQDEPTRIRAICMREGLSAAAGYIVEQLSTPLAKTTPRGRFGMTQRITSEYAHDVAALNRAFHARTSLRVETPDVTELKPHPTFGNKVVTQYVANTDSLRSALYMGWHPSKGVMNPNARIMDMYPPEDMLNMPVAFARLRTQFSTKTGLTTGAEFDCTMFVGAQIREYDVPPSKTVWNRDRDERIVGYGGEVYTDGHQVTQSPGRCVWRRWWHAPTDHEAEPHSKRARRVIDAQNGGAPTPATVAGALVHALGDTHMRTRLRAFGETKNTHADAALMYMARNIAQLGDTFSGAPMTNGDNVISIDSPLNVEGAKDWLVPGTHLNEEDHTFTTDAWMLKMSARRVHKSINLLPNGKLHVLQTTYLRITGTIPNWDVLTRGVAVTGDPVSEADDLARRHAATEELYAKVMAADLKHREAGKAALDALKRTRAKAEAEAAKHATTIAELEAQIALLRGDVVTQDEYDAARGDTASLQRTLDAVQAALTEAREEASRIATETGVTSAKQLAELQSAQTKIKNLEGGIERSARRLKQKHGEDVNTANQITKLEGELAEVKKQLSKANDSRIDAEKTLAELQSKHASDMAAHTQNVGVLEQELERMRRQLITGAEDAQRDMARATAQGTPTTHVAQDKVDALTAQLEGARASADTAKARMAEITQRNRELEDQIVDQRTQQNNIVRSDEALAAERRQVASLRQRIQEMRAQSETSSVVDEESQKAKEALAQAELRMNEMEGKNADLQAQMVGQDALQDTIARSEEDLRVAQEENAVAVAALDVARADAQKLRQVISELQLQSGDSSLVDEQLKIAQEGRNAAETRAEVAEGAQRASEASIATYKENVKELQEKANATNATLQRDLQRKTSENSELNDAKLQSELAIAALNRQIAENKQQLEAGAQAGVSESARITELQEQLDAANMVAGGAEQRAQEDRVRAERIQLDLDLVTKTLESLREEKESTDKHNTQLEVQLKASKAELGTAITPNSLRAIVKALRGMQGDLVEFSNSLQARVNTTGEFLTGIKSALGNMRDDAPQKHRMTSAINTYEMATKRATGGYVIRLNDAKKSLDQHIARIREALPQVGGAA